MKLGIVGHAAEKFTSTVTQTAAINVMRAQIAELKPGLIVSGDRKSTRLNSSHIQKSRMPSSA